MRLDRAQQAAYLELVVGMRLLALHSSEEAPVEVIAVGLAAVAVAAAAAGGFEAWSNGYVAGQEEGHRDSGVLVAGTSDVRMKCHSFSKHAKVQDLSIRRILFGLTLFAIDCFLGARCKEEEGSKLNEVAQARNPTPIRQAS